MKKILSLVLVLSMVLGSIGFAFAAPADVEGTEYEDAVTRLAALEILNGFPDGTFRPEETVTRAQFAKIMVTALGVGEAAKYAGGQTSFTDVAANHWASGYINVASDMKIINGYGDGNFGPEDQVTYAQAVTMIVRALGYEPKATAMGGYPGGYLAVAAEKEITEDVNVVNALAAIRGDVAVMVDASLTVPMMVQKTWGQYPEYEEDESKTLMTTKLGVDEVTGVVDAIPNTDSTLEADEIKVDGEKYDVLAEDINFDTLLGLEVTVWADGDDVFFVDVDTDSDDILFDTVKAADADDVTLHVEDDTFEWASDAKAYVNFEEVDLDEVSADAYGYVVLDSQDEVVYANLFEFTNNAKLVTEVEGEEIEVEGSGDLDLEDYEDGIHAYDKNFNKVAVEDIKVNSVVYSWEESDELYIVIVNNTVTGELERVKDTEVKVNGTEYSIDTDSTYSTDSNDVIESYVDADSLTDLVGETVEVVLDVNGDAHHVTGDVLVTGDLVFGLLKDSDSSSFAYKAKIFTQNGEEVVYEFEKSGDYTATYGGSDVSALAENTLVAFKLNKDGEIAEKEFYVYVTDKFVNSDTEDLTADYANVALANDGFYFDDADDMIVDTDTADASNNVRYYVENDTIIFNVEADNDAELVNFEDVEDITSAVTMNYIVKEAKGNDLSVVVFNQIETNTSDSEYAVVTENPWLTSDGWKVELNVFETGVKEYFLDSSIDEDSINEGQIISFNLNGDNEVSSVTVENTEKTVDQVDGKYIDTDASGTTWVKFDTDAVIYVLDEDKNIDKTLEYDEIDVNDKVIYATDADGRIVVLTVVTEATEEEEDTEVVTDGTVTYIDLTAGEEYIIVKGQEYPIIGNALEFFSNSVIDVNDAISYEVTDSGKIYKITAIADDVTLDASDNYSTFADLTVDGNLTINGASGTVTASNVTVTGNLAVDGGASLDATNFVVEGTTTVNTTGDVSFNSELKGNVTVTAVGTGTFTNVEFGGDVTVNAAGVTVKDATVAGDFTTTVAVEFDGSVDVTGTITGAANVTFGPNADQATKDAVAAA